MMKRLTGMMLAVLLLLSATAVAESMTNGLPTGVIINGPVTAYDGTWNNAAAVGTLQSGTGVIVMQQFGDMAQVFARVQRLAGWIPLRNVQIDQAMPVYPGVVISQNVSLRESPATNARLIASIPNGTVLDIYAEQNGWYTVGYWDGKSQTPQQGYVRVDFIVRDPSFVTTTQSTYVYAMPSRSAKKVGQLVSGTQLVVIGEFNDFWVVNLRSASGFIYKNDIAYGQITGGNG